MFLRFTIVSQQVSLEMIENTILQLESTLKVACTVVASPTVANRTECAIVAIEDKPFEIYNNEVIEILRTSNISKLGTEIGSMSGYCNYEVINDERRGLFQWSETEVNTTTATSCVYGPPDLMITRQCLSREVLAPANLLDCRTVVSTQFERFEMVNVTVETVATVVENLTQVVVTTNETSDQNTDNLKVITNTLTETSRLIEKENVPLTVINETTVSVVSVLASVDEWPQEVTQTQSNMIIQAFDSITENLIQQENFTEITVVTDDVALRGERLPRSDFRARLLSVGRESSQELTVATGDASATDTPSTELDSALVLPTGIVDSIGGNEDVRIAFTAYNETTLFPVRNILQANMTSVGSQVVSVTVAGIASGTKLTSPVQFYLKLIKTRPLEQDEIISNRLCVFWDFTLANGLGDWSISGCNMTSYNESSNIIQCQCDHLTNFACLVDISLRLPPNRNKTVPLPPSFKAALEGITYAGVFLSIVGLIMFIITFTAFKKLRNRDVTKFHVQLATSLLLMLVIFVAGIDKTENKGGCVAVGVLLHYFILTAWMLMAAEAALVFQKLVLVFSTFSKTKKYFIIVSLICWGLPLVPVVISVSIDTENYVTPANNITGAPGFCFISNTGVFFGAFFVPFILIILFNIVMFVPVVYVLSKHSIKQRKRKSFKNKSFKSKNKNFQTKDTCKMVLSILGIMFLLGLTWTVSLFTFVGVGTNRDAAFALQLIFVLLNSFQGFFLFIVFVVFNSDAREAWFRLICHKIVAKEHSISTAAQHRRNTNRSSSLTSDSRRSSLYKSPVDKNFPAEMFVMKNPNMIIEEEEEEVEDSPALFEESDSELEFPVVKLFRQSTIRKTHHIEIAELKFY